MIDRVDLGAGIASTLCHAALWIVAWIASWDQRPPEPPRPLPERQLVAVPETLPARAAAAVVLPAEASAPLERGAEAEVEPAELPPLDPATLDFEPQAQTFSEPAAAQDLGAGDRPEAIDIAPDLPTTASPLDELRARARAGEDRAAALDRAERQLAEARHVFAGWLRQAWIERWRPRYKDRIRNRHLLLLVTVDAQERVRDVRFLEGHGTGLDELDSLIQLHIAEQARLDRAWGLPPLPDQDLREYPFAVRLPR